MAWSPVHLLSFWQKNFESPVYQNELSNSLFIPATKSTNFNWNGSNTFHADNVLSMFIICLFFFSKQCAICRYLCLVLEPRYYSKQLPLLQRFISFLTFRFFDPLPCVFDRCHGLRACSCRRHHVHVRPALCPPLPLQDVLVHAPSLHRPLLPPHPSRQRSSRPAANLPVVFHLPCGGFRPWQTHQHQSKKGETSKALSCKYRMVQWDWFSEVTGCTWVTCIQWRQRTNFTAIGCSLLVRVTVLHWYGQNFFCHRFQKSIKRSIDKSLILVII